MGVGKTMIIIKFDFPIELWGVSGPYRIDPILKDLGIWIKNR